MSPMAHVVLDGVIAIHGQEVASLCETRMAQLRLPHTNLDALVRCDERLTAHLDGLSVAGLHAQGVLAAGLEAPSVGATFAASVRAIEAGDLESLQRLQMRVSDSEPALQ